MHTATSRASAEFSVSRVLGKNGTVAFCVKKIPKICRKNTKIQLNSTIFRAKYKKKYGGMSLQFDIWSENLKIERRRAASEQKSAVDLWPFLRKILNSRHFPNFLLIRWFVILYKQSFTRVLFNNSCYSEVKRIFNCVSVYFTENPSEILWNKVKIVLHQ